MILVDTNVLIDIASNDPAWSDWSLAQMEAASIHEAVAINDVVYAELSVRYASIEALDEFVALAGVEVVAIPRPALVLAGKVFTDYRRAGGTRNGVLPDFFIGAHAATAGVALLTRDVGRYRTYFPTLELIAPKTG